MSDALFVKVRDIIQRPYFRNAEIIASEKALERLVKWVHIMEVTRVGQLLNGNELILSTGIGWQDVEDKGISFLNQLIELNAAGLCIELGTYTTTPSERMRELAFRTDFPLILFHEEVRYVDITRDLHTFFINQHHKMISDLESLTAQFNRLQLSGRGMSPLLRLLQEKTRKQIAFIPSDGDPLLYPSISGQAKQRLLNELKPENAAESSNRTAKRPILVMNQTFAELVVHSSEELSEYDILALDRCATAVAQEMMRTIYVEERRRYKDNFWIQDWLNGKLKEKEITDFIRSMKPDIKLGSIAVCVFELELKTTHASEFETALIQRIIQARSIVEQSGFFLISALLDKHLMFILFDLQQRNSLRLPLSKVIERLRKTDKPNGLALFSGLAGVGPVLQELSALKDSYEAACETISIQKTIGPLRQPFYSELYVYRIIAYMEKTGQLTVFINDYLGPVLQYESKNNHHLLKTLKVYLQQLGLKKDTAKELFIVRQTLYHRLARISELLGKDFMSPEKRLTLELAIYAYEYLYGPLT